MFAFEVAPKQNDNRNPCSSRAMFISSCEQKKTKQNKTKKKSFKGVRIKSELFFRVCKTKSTAAGVTKTKT